MAKASEKSNSPAASPLLFLETLNAHQRTAAIRAAIDLDLFSEIAKAAATGGASVQELANACNASLRGARILCDYLTILGFLLKQEQRYRLTADSAAFLDRRSPTYMGGITQFMCSSTMMHAFEGFAGAVRKGGTMLAHEGTMAPEHPVWVDFARAMVPMMGVAAKLAAERITVPAQKKVRVLDVAAGHGMFGVSLATKHSNIELIAQDWPDVLTVAKENAHKAGLRTRLKLLPGDVFEIELGTGYDIVLLPNFLHHFDVPTCERLLRKLHAALKDEGKLVTVEFIPNEDRVSPPPAAAFAAVMLATTASGDAYTFAELEQMLKNAGYPKNEFQPLPPSPQSLVVSLK
jgi:2-polyprenyl-3-methyl-5-hydroxy-6-metoxy-1,4-benzoquinol methylase